jgi:hypothetical protein
VKIRFERKIQDIATYSPKMIETWKMFLQAYAISGEIFKKTCQSPVRDEDIRNIE